MPIMSESICPLGDRNESVMLVAEHSAIFIWRTMCLPGNAGTQRQRIAATVTPAARAMVVAGFIIGLPNSVVGTMTVHGVVRGQSCEVGATSSLMKARRQVFARRIARPEKSAIRLHKCLIG